MAKARSYRKATARLGDTPKPRKTPANPKSPIPFRVIADLLYGSHSWIERTGDLTYNCAKSEMARHYKTPSYRLEQYLEYLKEWGYVEKIKMYRHTITIGLRTPIISTQEETL